MSDSVVIIRFERENVEGIVPTGVTLADAARNFGIRFDKCKAAANNHDCAVIVTSGIDNLDPLTATETEHFDKNGRRSNERLACEARIIKPGEVVIMTTESTQQTTSSATAAKDIHSEFSSLPLDKKFASLLQMEATTVNEALKYVADASMKALEKLGDMISDLGAKVESEAKQATAANQTEPEPTAAASEPQDSNGSHASDDQPIVG